MAPRSHPFPKPVYATRRRRFKKKNTCKTDTQVEPHADAHADQRAHEHSNQHIDTCADQYVRHYANAVVDEYPTADFGGFVDRGCAGLLMIIGFGAELGFASRRFRPRAEKARYPVQDDRNRCGGLSRLVVFLSVVFTFGLTSFLYESIDPGNGAHPG